MVYRKLVELPGFLTEVAWSLTMQVIHGIFIHMSNVRSEVHSVSPRDSPTKNTAKVLHTLFRTHVVMQDFVLHEIKNHPEYVKLLATCSPNGEVRKLREVSASRGQESGRGCQGIEIGQTSGVRRSWDTGARPRRRRDQQPGRVTSERD